ncbi:hypothetical protein OIU77_017212 [Salix suchowensis]|uniref:Uncharacterized protein n=1 Tax=Salix suchowensis TaxID=1278906 RepID=A0ABQ8ZN09_9ROSI|nr:hypothetical protein OIU77_017212 [Salix suchowensis]
MMQDSWLQKKSLLKSWQTKRTLWNKPCLKSQLHFPY